MKLSKNMENRWFWGDQFLKEGKYEILDIHFQIWLTYKYVAGFGWVPQFELMKRQKKIK